MDQLSIREILFDSSEYKEALKLRYQVLRAPLGLQFSAEEMAKEPVCFHFAALQAGQVVGCLLLMPLDSSRVKMRQVAVSPTLQRAGVGKALVISAETAARQRSFREIVLHARDTAVGFYDRLGYERVGELFLENTIPHLLMRKSLP